MRVLLFTNKEDVTTDYIVRELKRQEIDFYRFNTEELSKSVKIDLNFEKEKYLLIDKLDNKTYNLLDFTDIYYRRPELPLYDDEGLTDGEKSFLQIEIYYTLEGVYRLLSGKHWFNNVFAIRNAENKIYQLLLAKEVGLTIPSTLISNHYDSVEQFLEKGNHIIKPVHNARIKDEKHPQIVYTSEIKQTIKKDEAEFNVNYLQKKIEKRCDVRATFVEEKCFAVTIDSQKLEETCVDWRKGEHILKHTPIELPREIRLKCIQLMKRLDLLYGAIDFVLDKQGNYFFLEINPNGQWAWIEHLTGLPISKEIVKCLCSSV
jgi:glutathione synthase/RimK-type ligase-like ATP-grasp enzyme